MKINFKHVATAALAVAMSLSLSVSALAEGTDVAKGSLTVKGDQLAGKYVYAIQMFEAHALDHGTEEDPQYTYDSYTLNEKWLTFFSDVNSISKQEWVDAGVIADTDDAIEDYSDAAVEYLQYLAEDGHEMKVPAFAEKAQDWAEKQKVFTRNLEGETGKVESVSITEGWEAKCALAEQVGDDETKGSAAFNALAAGYYLVYPEGGSTGINEPGVTPDKARGTDAMLLNIPNEKHQSWNIKSTFPTVDKTVDDGNATTGGGNADNGSAQVGDIVTFTLTSKVPDMSDYDEFYFAFNDTMSNGLQFVQKQSEPATVDADDVTVTIGDEPVSTDYYTVSLTGSVLKVEFTNLKNVEQAKKDEDIGKPIVVTYQAKITEAAVSGSGSIVGNAQNDVYLEYSNDPTTDTKGESTPDTSKVYTYDITVDKYELVKDAEDSDHDGSKEDMIEQGLAGATFVLSKDKKLTDNGSGVYTNAIGISTVSSQNYTYKVDPTSSTYEFTTVANADITIEGLEAGTYYLHEIDAPDGFNKLKEPVEIQIVVEPILGNDATNNATLDNPVYIIDGEANTAGDNAVKVENKKGIELPETGSIGTIGLTVAGVAIVLLGVFAPRKKKKSNQE